MQWVKGRRLKKAPAPIRVACVMRGAARADTADKREGDGGRGGDGCCDGGCAAVHRC